MLPLNSHNGRRSCVGGCCRLMRAHPIGADCRWIPLLFLKALETEFNTSRLVAVLFEVVFAAPSQESGLT